MSLLEVKDLSMTFQAGPPWARRPVQALRNINRLGVYGYLKKLKKKGTDLSHIGIKI